jgi:hypothetical protein
MFTISKWLLPWYIKTTVHTNASNISTYTNKINTQQRQRNIRIYHPELSVRGVSKKFGEW